MTNLTKKAIRSSFLKLIEQKPLNKITVRDVVTDCGINRNSFYYHYRDLPALCEEILREDCDRLIETYPSIESLEQGVDAILGEVVRSRRLLLHIYRSTDRALLEQFLWREARYVVESYLGVTFPMDRLSKQDREDVIAFLTADTFGQIMAGLESGLETDVIDRTRRLYALRHSMTRDFLERFGLDLERK